MPLGRKRGSKRVPKIIKHRDKVGSRNGVETETGSKTAQNVKMVFPLQSQHDSDGSPRSQKVPQMDPKIDVKSMKMGFRRQPQKETRKKHERVSKMT